MILLRVASAAACSALMIMGGMILWGIGSNLTRLDQINMPIPVAAMGALVGVFLFFFGAGTFRENLP